MMAPERILLLMTYAQQNICPGCLFVENKAYFQKSQNAVCVTVKMPDTASWGR
jgi:hypothetical protein